MNKDEVQKAQEIVDKIKRISINHLIALGKDLENTGLGSFNHCLTCLVTMVAVTIEGKVKSKDLEDARVLMDKQKGAVLSYLETMGFK